MVDLEDIKEEYPFSPKKMKLSSGHSMSYVDEGNGHPIVMIHGNPTWSFYYRNLIKHFMKSNRVVAPDNIGMGLSDKPQDYNYTLENHIQNLLELLASLKIDKATFIVHDWGGAIGFGVAARKKDLMSNIIVLNTAAFNSTDIPFRISICKLPIIGEFIVRAFNAFAWPATFMTTVKKLSTTVKRGYLLPYQNYNDRISVARFVKDIPLSLKHPTYKTLAEVEKSLTSINDKDVTLIWGEKDFCFTTKFRDRFLDFFPNARNVSFKDAGHYVIEDKLEKVIEVIGEEIREYC